LNAIDQCKKQGGSFVVKGGIAEGDGYESVLCEPCIAEVENEFEIVQHENFCSYTLFNEIFKHG